MRTLISKEFLNLLFSPKFIVLAVFGVMLALLSVFNGYVYYSSETQTADSEYRSSLKKMEEESAFQYLSATIIRYPDPLQIFDIGISGVLGRKAVIYNGSDDIAESSANRYEESPVLALFHEIDFTFIVSFVFSLFAILFSYNQVNGEREDGTLKLVIANSVSRPKIILAKLLGGFIPLWLIYAISFIFATFCLLLFTDIVFSGSQWLRLLMIFFIHTLFLASIYTIGLAISSLTRYSFLSFIITLSFWIMFVTVLPRIAIVIADSTTDIISSAEIYRRSAAERNNMQMTYEEAEVEYFKKNKVKWDDFQDNRQEIWQEIQKFQRGGKKSAWDTLFDEQHNAQKQMLRKAQLLSYVSPTSAMSSATHAMANSGEIMLARFYDAVRPYKVEFESWKKPKIEEEKAKSRAERQKREASGQPDVNTVNGFVYLDPNKLWVTRENLDLNGLPKFENPEPSLVVLISEALIPTTVLGFIIILAFVISYVAFLRYDVR